MPVVSFRTEVHGTRELLSFLSCHHQLLTDSQYLKEGAFYSQGLPFSKTLTRCYGIFPVSSLLPSFFSFLPSLMIQRLLTQLFCSLEIEETTVNDSSPYHYRALFPSRKVSALILTHAHLF